MINHRDLEAGMDRWDAEAVRANEELGEEVTKLRRQVEDYETQLAQITAMRDTYRERHGDQAALPEAMETVRRAGYNVVASDAVVLVPSDAERLAEAISSVSGDGRRTVGSLLDARKVLDRLADDDEGGRE